LKKLEKIMKKKKKEKRKFLKKVVESGNGDHLWLGFLNILAVFRGGGHSFTTSGNSKGWLEAEWKGEPYGGVAVCLETRLNGGGDGKRATLARVRISSEVH